MPPHMYTIKHLLRKKERGCAPDAAGGSRQYHCPLGPRLCARARRRLLCRRRRWNSVAWRRRGEGRCCPAGYMDTSALLRLPAQPNMPRRPLR